MGSVNCVRSRMDENNSVGRTSTNIMNHMLVATWDCL